VAETVFDRILRGEVPCFKVYEDEHVLAFLDIGPLSEGHTLVIPKEQAVTLDKLSEESAAAIGRLLPRLCRAVMRATGCASYNILQNNGASAHQAVNYVHFHIIPKPTSKEGLGIVWNAHPLEKTGAADLARRIAEGVES
jgi:histidine triad (HIT) family protein